MSDFASRFAAGSAIAGDLIDTYEAQRKKRDIAEIVAAQQLGTAPDRVEGTPDAVQAQLDSGSGVGEARKLASEPGTTQFSFLGKTSATPLDEAGMANARMQAMAGVMEKNGDPEAAMRYRQQATQGLRDQQRFKQEGTQFEWATKNQAQIEKDRARENDYVAGREKIVDPMLQNHAQFALDNHTYKQQLDAYNQAKASPGMEARDMGPAPVAPRMAEVTPGQQAEHYANLAAHDMKYGKMSAVDAFRFDQMMTTVKNENVVEALKLAQGGAPIEDVAKLFSSKGNMKFDPSQVVSDEMVKRGKGPESRIIKYRDADGSIKTIDTLPELDRFKAAGDVWSRFHQGNQDAIAQGTLDVHKQSVGIQARTAAASIAHSEASTDEIKQRTQDKKDLADIHDDLNTAIDKGDAKAEDAARKKLTTYMARSRGTGMGTLEMNANLYLASGKAKNMSEALDMAHSKVQSTPKDDYIKFTTGAMPRSPEDLNRDMTVLHGPNWKEKMNPTVQAAGSFATQADADAAFKAGKIKAGDRISINGVPGTWK